MSIKSAIANFFRSLFSGLVKRHGQKLLDFALGQAIGFASVLVSSELSGAEKKEIVKKQLTASLSAQGKEIAQSELNLLIELAVQHIKSQ